jgi:peroxiredoxin
MLHLIRTSFLLSLFAIAVLAAVPKVGDRVPPFSLPSSKGTNVELKDYAGKRNVVLVFYRGYW